METLHPAIVHFAVVLPLVALTFKALFMLKKDQAYAKASFVLIVFGTLAVVAAYVSGADDAKNVGEILSTYHDDGMKELLNHAVLGLYLLIAFGLIALLEIANFLFFRKAILNILVLLALLAVSAMMLVQGKVGGSIVYEHGTIFEAHEIKDILTESLLDLKDSADNTESVEILTDAVKSSLKIEE